MIPLYLDIDGLCQCFPLSKRSVDVYIKMHGFPQPRMRGGKKIWKTAEVEAWYDGGETKLAELTLMDEVRHATRKAVNGG